MSFLAPLAFWVAAIVVPALLILYFLKLRRRQEIVPSTLLWRRAVQDLQVNAPFQKLRKNLLLFLQLLILALGVFALARPMIETSVSDEHSVVLLIDRSASMNTLEGDKTRFEMAKEYAVRHVETLNRTRSRWWSFFGGAEAQARVMAIAFADRAVVVSPFTGNMTDVVDLIEKLEPTDGRTNMREALELAEAYMMQTTLEQTPETAEEASAIVLFSDGAVHGVEDVVLRAGRLTLIPIGETKDNVGITALRIQRNYERPELLSTLLQLENFGPKPVTTDVSLYIDGRLATVQTVERLAAARARGADAVGSGDTGDGGPEIASAALSFEFALETGGLLEARLSRDDALLVDNRAFVVVPPPRRLSVLLVSKQNFFVESALQGLSLEKYDYLTPEQYEQAPADEIELNGQSLYDVVILDKHSTSRLPSGNYVFLGAVPENEGITIEDELEDHSLQWWDETHPILRNVALDYVFAARGLVLKTPPRAEKLIEGPRGSVLFRYSNEGRHYLVLSFAIENSSWWGKVSFPKFVQNAVLFMGSGGALAEREPLRPGDPLRIPLPADTETATLRRPDGGRATIRPDARGVARYAATHRVGVYRVEPGVAGRDRFAVNLESASESDITPRASFPLGGAARIEVGDAIRSATPEIWRWFIGAALLIAFLEWFIYNRRVMI
ncbi:MAG: BatA and WFA domain-containing protein [Planctomycetes bacterium]|nr:BatA and WFA domain-containing protein [Planctomycetota bacterium]